MFFRVAEYLIEATASPPGPAVVAAAFLLRARARSCSEVSWPKPTAWYSVESPRSCGVQPSLERHGGLKRCSQPTPDALFNVLWKTTWTVVHLSPSQVQPVVETVLPYVALCSGMPQG